MEQDILLLFAGNYSVADERTGVINEGCSVSYYMLTDLSAKFNQDGTIGLRPAKCSVDSSFLGAQITRAPALYSAKFGLKVGSNGKPTLYIEDLVYKSDVVMDRLFTGDADAAAKETKK